jgi:hypothetical protein
MSERMVHAGNMVRAKHVLRDCVLKENICVLLINMESNVGKIRTKYGKEQKAASFRKK